MTPASRPGDEARAVRPHHRWCKVRAAVLDVLVLAYPAKRYRSAWVSIAVHSVQSVFLTVLLLRLVA